MKISNYRYKYGKIQSGMLYVCLNTYRYTKVYIYRYTYIYNTVLLI